MHLKKFNKSIEAFITRNESVKEAVKNIWQAGNYRKAVKR